MIEVRNLTRKYGDYRVEVDLSAIPDSITCTRMV